MDPLPGADPPRSHDVGDNAGSHSIGTHGADDASTREYRTGDDLRKIHWKSSARSGSLMVRQEERPWQGRGTLLLDLRSVSHAHGEASAIPADLRSDDWRQHDSLEWAVSAAASIATHLQLAHQDVELVYGTPQHPLASPAVPLQTLRQTRDLLAEVTASTDRDLSECAVALARSARDSSLIAILGTPDQATLHMLLEVTTRRRGTNGIALILDTHTWAGGAPEPEDGAAHTAVRRLRASGWRASVVQQGESIADVWGRVVAEAPMRAVR